MTPERIAQLRHFYDIDWNDLLVEATPEMLDEIERLQKERAAIVAWLRKLDGEEAHCYTQDDSVCWVADAIEAGEHLK